MLQADARRHAARWGGRQLCTLVAEAAAAKSGKWTLRGHAADVVPEVFWSDVFIERFAPDDKYSLQHAEECRAFGVNARLALKKGRLALQVIIPEPVLRWPPVDPRDRNNGIAAQHLERIIGMAIGMPSVEVLVMPNSHQAYADRHETWWQLAMPLGPQMVFRANPHRPLCVCRYGEPQKNKKVAAHFSSKFATLRRSVIDASDSTMRMGEIRSSLLAAQHSG